jgi:DMSO/TMAO reductase YedYZ molybdopterin-dependent catalytic subunit
MERIQEEEGYPKLRAWVQTKMNHPEFKRMEQIVRKEEGDKRKQNVSQKKRKKNSNDSKGEKTTESDALEPVSFNETSNAEEPHVDWVNGDEVEMEGNVTAPFSVTVCTSDLCI